MGQRFIFKGNDKHEIRRNKNIKTYSTKISQNDFSDGNFKTKNM
jgi:hypothetical protein